MKVKRLVPDAKLPTRAYEGDLGFDLYATHNAVLRPGEGSIEIHTGIAIEFPAGFGGIIKDRGSMAKNSITSHGGVFDNGYRGEVIILLQNAGPGTAFIGKGQKVAQMVLIPIVDASVEEVHELSSSERGEKRYGSSGA